MLISAVLIEAEYISDEEQMSPTATATYLRECPGMFMVKIKGYV